MSTREVIVLGTASQVPTRERNHHALFMAWDGMGILFDPGEGTQRQLIQAGVSATQITHIAITHFHGDHCLGLAGIVQRLSLDRVTHPVEVIYPASGQVYFERLRHASIFHEVANLIPRPVQVPTEGLLEVCRSGNARLLAGTLEHSVECQGYRLQEDDVRRMLPEKLEVLGIRGPAVGQLLRQGHVTVDDRIVRVEEVSEVRKGQAFALVMDTRQCAGAEILSKGTDMLVCESTYLQEEAEEAHSHYHLTAAQAAQLAQAGEVDRLVLTHFSQRYAGLEGFQREADELHNDVVVARDLMRVPLPSRRSEPG